jgi:hypothetical protein
MFYQCLLNRSAIKLDQLVAFSERPRGNHLCVYFLAAAASSARAPDRMPARPWLPS